MFKDVEDPEKHPTTPSKATESNAGVLKRPSTRTTMSSLNTRKSVVAKRRESRKVLSGKDDLDPPTIDPFVGKTVAFGCNTAVGSSIIGQLGKKYDNRGVCYDLDSTGHIVGTASHMNKMAKSKKQVATNYNIVWEFTAFGESDLAGFLLIDGEKEGQ